MIPRSFFTALSWCSVKYKVTVFLNHPQAKPSRLHCSHCDETYSLPQNGAIKLYKELKCPLDEFELVLWTSGSRGKSYPVCPYCFSNPPFRDTRKGRRDWKALILKSTCFKVILQWGFFKLCLCILHFFPTYPVMRDLIMPLINLVDFILFF